MRIDIRTGEGNLANIRKYAAELVSLAPDVIVAAGATPVASLLEATHTVPIVFTIVVDPIGAGFVEKLSRPGGNATGFMMFDYSLSGKWLELLKQVAPNVTQAAVVRDLFVCWGWPVCGDTGCGTVAWHGSDHYQCQGRTRDR